MRSGQVMMAATTAFESSVDEDVRHARGRCR
jgi:hypothetical protein